MSAWMAVQLCSLGLSSVSRDENSTQANPFHDGDNFSHRDEQIHMRQPTDKLLSGRPIGRLPSAQIPTALIGSVQALAPSQPEQQGSSRPCTFCRALPPNF